MNIQSVILTYLTTAKEATGYQIAKYMKTTTGNSHQQVYRTLGSLERDGYITHRVEPQEGKPDRNLYQIVDAAKTYNWVHNNVCTRSDFSKTGVSYSLACVELEKNLVGTLHKQYIEAMKKAEDAFMDSLPSFVK